MNLEQALKLPDGIYENIPEDVYHALPYVSSTYLRRLGKNPAKAKTDDKDTTSKLVGSGTHALSLEGEKRYNASYFVLPKSQHHASSNKAKEEKAAWLTVANGRTILTTEQDVTIRGCAAEIIKHPVGQRLLAPTLGKPEVTVIFTDELTGLRCKARIDRLPDPVTRAALDLKTAADASRFGFARSILKYGYHIQAAHYVNALNTAGVVCDTFMFVIVETSPPYQVLTGMLSPDYLNIGMMEVQRLMALEMECRELGFYPNIQLPEDVSTLTQIYEKRDGQIYVKNHAELIEIFEPPKYL